MKNTKLIKLLKTFSKQEINRFSEFIISPYFNKNKNVISLGNDILRFYPDFDTDKLSEQSIFTRLFPDKDFDYYGIKNLISDLLQLAVSFLSFQSSEKNTAANDINLLNEFHERMLEGFYVQRERRVREYMQNTVKDEDYFFNRFRLAKINTSHFKFEKSGYTFNQIQNEFDRFLDYSLVGLLRYYSKMLHNKNHGNITFNMEMFSNVMEYVKNKDFAEFPSCQIYKQIIALELSRKEDDYRKLISLKKEFGDALPVEDIYYILLIINSYSAYRLRLGDESYYTDRFGVFKEMVEREFTPASYMIYPNFINTYTSACMVDEFDWADKFMIEYRNGISPAEEKTSTVNYCHGFKAYKLGNYDEALKFFSKTNFKLFLYKVMVKSYTSRIFYEKNMYEQTLSAVDAFRHYLKSEKLIVEEQKKAHYEFLILLRDLSTLKIEGSKPNTGEALFILSKKIAEMSSNPLGAKNWLLRKVEEMKGELK